MRGTPYIMRRRILLSPSRCRARRRRSARWSRSTSRPAVDSGRCRSAPCRGLVPADMARRCQPDWGSPNLGGPIVTAGGVVFIGAALDRSLHAYDIETGRELWRGDAARERQGDADELSARVGRAVRRHRRRRWRRLGNRRPRRRVPAAPIDKLPTSNSQLPNHSRPGTLPGLGRSELECGESATSRPARA